MSSAITQTPPKPHALQVRPETIPAELQPRLQWVVWRYTWKNGRYTKVPLRADGAGAASSTDPATWGAFGTACEAYRRSRGTPWELDGIGFALDGRPDALGRVLVGLDFDKVAEGGRLRPPFDTIIPALGTYWEWSPSGAGVRAFGFGQNLGRGVTGTIAGCGVEIYTAGRYLTVTGHA